MYVSKSSSATAGSQHAGYSGGVAQPVAWRKPPGTALQPVSLNRGSAGWLNGPAGSWQLSVSAAA